MKRWRPPNLPLLLAFYIGASVLAPVGCDRIERGKQVRAQGALQYLAAIIEGQREQTGSFPSAHDLEALVDAQRLEDPWGGRIRYETFDVAGQPRYVLASVGSDGKLDVSDVRDYLAAPSEDVAYEPRRDIVLVDGVFVRNAGK